MNGLFEERVSSIEGLGCFATRSIQAGEVVERWEGQRVPLAELKRIEAEGKYHSSIAMDEETCLLLNVIAPSPQEGLAEGSGVGGFNHSCDANLWLADAVTVVARREIAQGEELTFDYALASDDADYSLAPCHCGSPACRGTVRGDDWRLPEVQDRYRDHFSPFINRRIHAASSGQGR
jgi:uncharacterized protein